MTCLATPINWFVALLLSPPILPALLPASPHFYHGLWTTIKLKIPQVSSGFLKSLFPVNDMHANDIPKTLCPILSRSFTASPACGFPSGSSVVIQLFSRALNTSHCILPAAFENWYISILQARINIEAKAQWELWGDGERFLIFVFAYAARQSIIHSIPSNICALRPGLRGLFFCKTVLENEPMTLCCNVEENCSPASTDSL
ncbi:hypothetical protein B0H10DRAFT_2190767 [Mycena sp. CBHHK59/15]|nr:hypothetical protein B0H10DRAFT_2196381 [Mycena sp. CBHHK59/15]KAJ6615934.1 hypothetical protein B0H10DRAFT_2190767 [Mycena sp. CBHHK59/15]